LVRDVNDWPLAERTEEALATLEAGTYVLLCNIFDEDEDEAHYAMGMRVAFPVQ
jgi:hypothetical protein